MYEFPILGQINIYRFVPLDNTYTNTLHFENREAQLAYFGCKDLDTPTAPTADTIMKLQYTQQTYTRNERQYIRIESNANILYDCNYLAYQNRNFGEQWFFAFVTNVEYINDYVTEIEFELDVMQTFMWNYELRECFVVREHCLAKDDVLGKNLQPEQLPEVAYQFSRIQRTDLFNNYKIVFFTTFQVNNSHQPMQPTVPYMQDINGVPFAGDISIFDIDNNGVNEIRQFLSDVESAGAVNGIITAFIYPEKFLYYDGEVKPEFEPVYRLINIQKPTTISGYVPKNKKLFNFPYTTLRVDYGNGEKAYRFEYFKDPDNVQFQLGGVLTGIPQVTGIPRDYYNMNYQDSTGASVTDYSMNCTMESFPTIAVTVNEFSNWLTQNMPSIVLNTFWGLGQMGMGLAITALSATSFNAPVSTYGESMAMGGFGSILHEAGTVCTMANTPAGTRSTSSILSDVITGTRDFFFKIEQPTSEGAKQYDTFFSMYGYAVNKVKVPNIVNYSTCRPNWNYLKATNCNFHWDNRPKGTSVPQKYMRKIISIFEHGLTFWKNPNNVGNYLDDSGNLNPNGEQ